MNTHATLFDSIQRIRMLAASIYDAAEAKNTPPHEIQKKIEPLHGMLESCIKIADAKDLIMTLKEFEVVQDSHLQMVKMYNQKLRDLHEHSKKVEARLIHKIKERGANYLSEGDFMATIVTDGEVERVSLR